jgi:hypothetical protein
MLGLVSPHKRQPRPSLRGVSRGCAVRGSVLGEHAHYRTARQDYPSLIGLQGARALGGYGKQGGRGWLPSLGISGAWQGASRGLDNSPEDGFLAAMGGCGGKTRAAWAGKQRSPDQCCEDKSGLLGLRRGLGPLRPSRRANPSRTREFPAPSNRQKTETVSVRHSPTETVLSLPCVQAFRERCHSLLPRGSEAKTAARIVHGNNPTPLLSTTIAPPRARPLTAVKRCAAIPGRGSHAPRRVTSRAPAVLPPG